ncbi:hypothetical protein BDZ97DRAFT_1755263 [Flammula alnicola]|nr:hypothetical protein BDZ97DRAFT_1755263 [Flammula alnicola]
MFRGNLVREPPVLPPDIIITILDELALNNDTASLKACSLVSRSFVPLCQKHIFHTLFEGDHHHVIIPFFALVVKSPHLIRYMRVIRLQNYFQSDHDANELSVILNCSTSLKRLELINYGASFGLVPMWHPSTARRRLQQALFHKVTQPGLESLHVETVQGLPFTFFNSAIHLKSLTIKAVIPWEEEDKGVQGIKYPT